MKNQSHHVVSPAPAPSRHVLAASLRALLGVIYLCALFGLAATAAGQTIVNPSFEVDPRPPGNGDGPITGWPASGGASGINDSTGPFTNSGTIPDGPQVAFIYHSGTMHQVVSGFTVGTQYVLRYYENARVCCAPRTANLQVTVGGVPVVPTHAVLAVGGTNPYVQKTSQVFTANAASLDVAFITSGSGDFTVLLDKVEVSRNLVVTNNADGGAGSLRQAVLDALPGITITFSEAVRGVISLTTGQMVIDKNLTIAGPGADRLNVRNGASNGIFQVNAGVTATISGLTVAESLDRGVSNDGTLTVADCVVRDNGGGGIFNRGVLAVTNSNILHNSSGVGGGIYNIGRSSSVAITNSSITGNLATGATILVDGTTVKIWGSAIFNHNGSVTVTNSTIAGNEDRGFGDDRCYLYPGQVCPPYLGSAILLLAYAEPGPTPPRSEVTLINSTVTDNILAAAFDGPSTVTARNSIINGLTTLGGSSATLYSQGYNLIVNLANMTIQGDTTGNILNAAPRLGPLGYYGGPTLTRALLTGSPAINTGNTATSPAADQRGAARVGPADIGAFELNNSANGGNFVAQLPDAFTEIAYSHLLVEDTSQNNTVASTYSLTGGALPTGLLLSTTSTRRVLVSGRTAQTGVFAFSVTATAGTNSFVTDYRLRVLPSGAPPHPGGCLSNPVVTNSSDSGEGTLRQAVLDACAGGTITFAETVRGRIALTSGPLEIGKNLTIAGPGADALTIRNGAGIGRQNHVIHVNFGNATVLVSGLTISDGYADSGAGISNGGNLTLRNAVITNNHSDGPGGGIASGGTLALVNSIVTGNGDPTLNFQDGRAQGGGIYFIGTSLTVTDSTVSRNLANEGGGIYVDYGASVSMTNSTIRENDARIGSVDGGGGLLLADGTATLTNCTVSQNSGGGTGNAVGGGISLRDSSILTLINSTIANNSIDVNPPYTFGGGIAIRGAGTVNARNSIIAGNTTTGGAPGQFAGTLTSQGYNLISSRQGMTITGVTTGNIVPAGSAVIDAKLGPLAHNGGPTMTHALLTGSPAINAGNTATSPATDQRGAARVGTADIGAFEVNNSATFNAQMPDGVAQAPYSYTITPDRGAFTYSLSGGALPGGLSLSTNGAIVSVRGTPNVSGSFQFAVTATNGTNTFVTNYTLTIVTATQAPAITSATNTTFVVGTAGTFTVTATGLPTPTLSQTGTLPSGVTFTPATGVLSGTPAAGTGGTYRITFTATNGVGSNAVQSFTLSVNQAPAITSANSTTFVAGTFGSFTLMKTGTPAPTVSMSGALPPGVSFTSATGVLSGTPARGSYGTYALTFTASNGVGSNAVQNFSLVVNPSAQDVRSKSKIEANPGGGYRSTFLGNPGQQYTVQFSPSLQPANWQFLSVQTAGADGTFVIIDNPPAGTRQRFYRALIPNGWTAQYYKDAGNGIHLAGTPLATRRDATINFSDASGWAETLVPGLGVDRFSVRWSGQFLAPATANYTFYTTSDDGVRLSIDGQTVIENWTDHAPTVNSVTVALEAGEFYPIVLEFYENAGGAVISLEYEAPGVGIPRQIVPADRVY